MAEIIQAGWRNKLLTEMGSSFFIIMLIFLFPFFSPEAISKSILCSFYRSSTVLVFIAMKKISWQNCSISVNKYTFIVDNGNTRKRYEICSKLTIKIAQRCHWRRSGVFLVNFGHISHLFLAFPLLNLNT